MEDSTTPPTTKLSIKQADLIDGTAVLVSFSDHTSVELSLEKILALHLPRIPDEG